MNVSMFQAGPELHVVMERCVPLEAIFGGGFKEKWTEPRVGLYAVNWCEGRRYIPASSCPVLDHHCEDCLDGDDPGSWSRSNSIEEALEWIEEHELERHTPTMQPTELTTSTHKGNP